jgi:large subunit ribosomal protein L15
MQLHEISTTTKRQTKKRVGRGGLRGKTSGRGMKGQKARKGNSVRPAVRDVIKKIPKLRGHGKNRARTVVPKLPALVVNVAELEHAFEAGAVVTPESLAAAKLIAAGKSRNQRVKVLGQGNISKKLTITGCQVSKTAAEKITAAGGTIATTPDTSK